MKLISKAGSIISLLLLLFAPMVGRADNIAFGANEILAGSHSPSTYLNGETINIGNGKNIWVDINGNVTAQNPLLIIFGLPNITGAANTPVITGAKLYETGTNPCSGLTSAQCNTKLSGVTTDPVSFTNTGSNPYTTGNTNGFYGDFKSGELYGFLGLSAANNSQQFQANWQTWDETELGPTPFQPPNFYNGQPISYGIYIFALTPQNGISINSKHDAVLDISTLGLPIGSYVVGYSIDAKGNPIATPFTTAGFATGVPEPGTMAMLATGFLGLVAAIRRKRAN